MSTTGSHVFSGLYGTPSNYFMYGAVDDKGAYGGKANAKGFDQNAFRYGYLSQDPGYEYIPHYHYIQHAHNVLNDIDDFSNQ